MNLEKFTDRAKGFLQSAQTVAIRMDHQRIAPEHVLKALQEKAGYLHSLLFKRLHIHTVPTLHFHYDSSVEHGIEMSRLIDQAVESDQKDETK